MASSFGGFCCVDNLLGLSPTAWAAQPLLPCYVCSLIHPHSSHACHVGSLPPSLALLYPLLPATTHLSPLLLFCLAPRSRGRK